MGISELNHYFVRANDLEQTKQFYCDALGFEVMPRPQFSFPGYWLGIGGKVQIHMGPHGIAESDAMYLGTTERSATDNAGVVDHIAFLATDPEGVHTRLEELGISSRTRFFAEFGLCQLFVADPNGLMIELNFHGVTTEPSW